MHKTAVVICLLLTACAHGQPKPLAFDLTGFEYLPDVAEKALLDGPNTITGSAFIRQAGGGIVTGGLAEIQENFSKKQPNSLIFKKLLA